MPENKKTIQLTADQQAFREHVIGVLSSLDAGQKTVISRLDDFHESIRDLYSRAEANEKALIEHAANCVIGSRVHDLDIRISRGDASRKTSEKWLRILQPVIWALLTGLIILILKHGDLILAQGEK